MTKLISLSNKVVISTNLYLTNGLVSSIGVYGMGGVGKTTLAKHIHNRLLQQSQKRVFWVTVSQEFTVTSLQEKIARVFGVDLSNEDNEDKRAARLHRALSQMKNSVLILDDVWENIDMLKVGCPFSMECCRLIITTRSLEVCRQIRCQEIIRVQILYKDEAWKLFNETLGNEIQLGPGVEEIAKSMAKMCDGLPLGIISVAGSMRGETSIHTWTNALAELKECVAGQDGMGEVDKVFKVLKYSFDRLNRNHESEGNGFNTFQLCFMYYSFFPEDFQIHMEELIRQFISDGLMDGRRAQIHKGHSILDKLVNVCLLETCGYNNERVKMHDLVRGMALMIGEGKYMVRAGDRSLKQIPDEKEWTKDMEKVSFMGSGITRIVDGTSPNCPNLSTLLLLGNPLEYIPDSFFSKMTGLCTLDLCSTIITMLRDSIFNLKRLKALLLSCCSKLEYVPYLGNLNALRELNLSDTAIKEVPQGLEELLNLNILAMDAPHLKMLPSGLLLKLGHLQHLNVPLHVQVPIREFEDLKQIEEFHGGVKNVNDFNRFIRSRGHDPSFYKIGVGLDNIFRIIFFGDLGFHINELVLSGCNLEEEKLLGQGIVHLTLMKCEGLSSCFMDDLSQLNNPTFLKRLTISRCGETQWILRSEQGLESQLSKTLERIELLYLDDLKEVVIQKSTTPAQPVFSSLVWLSIVGCNKMKKLGLPVLGIPNLVRIQIEKCGEIEEIFEDEGRGSSVTLPKLEALKLQKLPRLKSVCRATMICNSIISISIGKCPRLMKKLPVHVDDPPSIPTSLVSSYHP